MINKQIIKSEYNKSLNLLNELKDISFDKLEPEFTEVMKYVSYAVDNGFKMDNDIVKICSYQSKKNKGVDLELKTESGGYPTRFNLFKEEKEENNFRIILKWLVGADQNPENESYSTLSIKGIVEKFKDYLLNSNDERKIKQFTYQIKNMLSLPKIMNEYLTKKILSLEGFLKEIKEDIKD